MSEYVGKVGKKGELYMPEELRAEIGLNPGDDFLVTIGMEGLIVKKGKKISDLLMEEPIAKVTGKEMGEIRKELEKEIIER
jgi:bifunctional DNA-binding transcriptional regulator/antitoxin component of YhaV-PrlF toxin-antitoxin module